MDFNQRTDYRVSRATAFEWWKEMSADGMQVHGITEEAKAEKPEQGVRRLDGLWIILNPKYSQLAAIATRPLEDASGEWGLAVLWYDREKCSRFSRMLNGSKLSRSQGAAALIGRIITQQGGQAFAPSDQPVKQT